MLFIHTIKLNKLYCLNDHLVFTNCRFTPILFRELLKTSASLEEKGKSINERFLKNQYRFGEA